MIHISITCTVSMVCWRTGLPAPASRSLKNCSIWPRSLLVEKCPVTELMMSPMLLSLPNREKKWDQCERRWFHASGPPWNKKAQHASQTQRASRCKESAVKGHTKRVSSDSCYDGWHILILHLTLTRQWARCGEPPAPVQESCWDIFPGSTCPCSGPVL